MVAVPASLARRGGGAGRRSRPWRCRSPSSRWWPRWSPSSNHRTLATGGPARPGALVVVAGRPRRALRAVALAAVALATPSRARQRSARHPRPQLAAVAVLVADRGRGDVGRHHRAGGRGGRRARHPCPARPAPWSWSPSSPRSWWPRCSTATCSPRAPRLEPAPWWWRCGARRARRGVGWPRRSTSMRSPAAVVARLAELAAVDVDPWVPPRGRGTSLAVAGVRAYFRRPVSAHHCAHNEFVDLVEEHRGSQGHEGEVLERIPSGQVKIVERTPSP